jgi:outer membrane protein TolC
VVLGASYDVGGSPSNLSGTWSVTLSLSDGGITRERIREAELRLEQLKVLEAQTKQRIELKVRQAWLALDQAAAEVTAAAGGVEQGREAARIAGVRYQAGVGTSLELLSAQAGLAQAELALASARFNQNFARVRLILAAGGSL